VYGDYFDAIGLRILRGRPFDDRDDAQAARVALVNESFAAAHWPGEDVIGKRVAALYTDTPEWMTIVGLVADVKQNTLDGADDDAIYVPYLQRQMPWARFGTLVARGPVDAATLTTGIKEALWAVDPTVPLDDVSPMPELVSASIAPRRFASTLLTLFAALALLIAVQGLYGVLSYAVAQRRGEIGVRIALGARAGDVLRLVLRQGGTLAVIGLAAGFGLAVLGTRLLGGLLYGVEPTDPPTYFAVGVALVTTALIAAAIPAARATRVDPLEALRKE
jgi:predicted permease